MWRPFSDKCGKAYYLKHCMCVASDTEKIQSSDWRKWCLHCEVMQFSRLLLICQTIRHFKWSENCVVDMSIGSIVIDQAFRTTSEPVFTKHLRWKLQKSEIFLSSPCVCFSNYLKTVDIDLYRIGSAIYHNN